MLPAGASARERLRRWVLDAPVITTAWSAGRSGYGQSRWALRLTRNFDILRLMTRGHARRDELGDGAPLRSGQPAVQQCADLAFVQVTVKERAEGLFELIATPGGAAGTFERRQTVSLPTGQILGVVQQRPTRALNLRAVSGPACSRRRFPCWRRTASSASAASLTTWNASQQIVAWFACSAAEAG